MYTKGILDLDRIDIREVKQNLLSNVPTLTLAI